MPIKVTYLPTLALVSRKKFHKERIFFTPIQILPKFDTNQAKNYAEEHENGSEELTIDAEEHKTSPEECKTNAEEDSSLHEEIISTEIIRRMIDINIICYKINKTQL